MYQPLEAKLRRLRELSAKAEKLKVDVNRLWRRFPPLPNSYVGVGLGVPEGDPQLTRTVTTPEHFPCKRLFTDCNPPIYTVYINSFKRYAIGSIVSDTYMEGRTFTFDAGPVFAANGYGCSSGGLDFSVGSRYLFEAGSGFSGTTYIANDNVCDIDDETFTGVDIISAGIYLSSAPAPWSPSYAATLRCSYISVTTPEGSVKKPVYGFWLTPSFSGAIEAYEVKQAGYPSGEQGEFQDGCDPGPLEIGESRTFSQKIVSVAGTFKALEVTLTRVA